MATGNLVKKMEKENKKKKFGINKTWVLIAVLIILTGILLAVSIYGQNREPSQEIAEKTVVEVEKDVANTILDFSPSPRISTTSGRYEMDINIYTNGDNVTFAQLELNYDPNILRIYDIKPGEIFSNPNEITKNIDDSRGRIKFWLEETNSSIINDGVIATITFTKIGTGEATLNFEPKTSVTADGINESVLKEFFSGIINELPTPEPIKLISPTPALEQIQ